jgi:hypothetical protein
LKEAQAFYVSCPENLRIELAETDRQKKNRERRGQAELARLKETFCAKISELTSGLCCISDALWRASNPDIYDPLGRVYSFEEQKRRNKQRRCPFNECVETQGVALDCPSDSGSPHLYACKSKVTSRDAFLSIRQDFDSPVDCFAYVDSETRERIFEIRQECSPLESIETVKRLSRVYGSEYYLWLQGKGEGACRGL